MSDDVVADVMGDSHPLSSPTGGAQGDVLPEGVSERAQARFKALLAERNQLRDQVSSFAQGAASLEQKLSGSAREEPKRDPKSWSEVPETDLMAVLKSGASADPNQFGAAIDEIIERRVNQQLELKAEDLMGKVRGQTLKEQIQAKIATDFGADAMNQESALFQRADAYYIDKIKRIERMHPGRGREMVNADPYVELECFERAQADITRVDKTEVEKLRQELEMAKRAASGERGNMSNVAPTEEYNTALKERDYKKAIRSLRTSRAYPLQE